MAMPFARHEIPSHYTVNLSTTLLTISWIKVSASAADVGRVRGRIAFLEFLLKNPVDILGNDRGGFADLQGI